MGWKTIAYGTDLESFENSLETDRLPHGTEMVLEIDTSPYPIAPLADLWGAEWVVDMMLNNDVTIEDVEGEGWYKIIVHMTANSNPFIIVAAIVVILLSLGYLINNIRLLANMVEGEIPDWGDLMKYGVIAGIGILALAILIRR